jgi:predicted  nucleic acid-binding Zn-ribbon protein
MTDKKKPPFDDGSDPKQKKIRSDDDFDPTIPEEGVTVPEDTGGTIDFIGSHLPSTGEIASAARETFGNSLPEELIQDLMRSSTEINESVRRIMHEHMALGFRFGEILRTVHRAYIANYGDSTKTLQRARADAYFYIEKLHRFSHSKIRLHLDSYAKFHANSEAVEFLRQTDMQLLLGKDIGDEIVNAVIDARKANPEMSTREVRDLIAAYRHKQDELTATLEQVETLNNELAKLNSLYDLSRAEENRLNRDMEQMRIERTEARAATDRLRNELSLVGNSKNALHQELSDVQNQLAELRREKAQPKISPPIAENEEALADLNRLNAEFLRLMKASADLEAKIEAQKAEEAEAAARLQEAEAALDMQTRVDETMNALVVDFGEFVQKYHSAQLLCTAGGKPERCKPVFSALADVVGKFHAEIELARKAT